MRELVFGLEDGLVSTMGVVVGVAAGTAEKKVVILTGLVLIVVEALSMAAGSFLSSKSHREMLEKKIRDEEIEIETKPEEEKEELRVMYRQRGFSPEEIEILVRRITADKKLWLEEMMAKELQIGASDLVTPKNSALIMGVTYIVGGAVPVLPYFFLPLGAATITAVGCTILALFIVGYVKAKATGNHAIRSGAEMMLISVSAAVAGYLVGKIVSSLSGIEITS